MVRRAMKHPVGWKTSAAAYAKTYADLLAARHPGAEHLEAQRLRAGA
jgi:hypothetical protein